MINAASSTPSENPQPVTPVDQAIKNNFQPSVTSTPKPEATAPKTDSISDSPAITFNATPPGSKPKKKSKMSMKMILGGILLVLLVVGSGVGLYLSQQTQDIRQDASLGPGTDPGDGSSPTTTAGETCNYDCTTGHPETPIVSGTNCGTVRAMDVCRGKGYTGSPDGKYFNCQLCRLSDAARNNLSDAEKAKRSAQNWYACPGEQTDADASGCDYSCLCGNADQNNCYEKGPSHDAGVFNGNYNCKNTQVDVVLNGEHKWNCTSSDNKDWSQCAPASQPASCQSAVIDAGTVVNGVRMISPTQDAIYSVTGTEGTTSVEFCFHAKNLVGSRTWSQDWHCLKPPKAGSGQNLYRSSFKLNDIKNAIIGMNTGYTAAILDADGYRYATRIYTTENVFCTGSGVWSDGGTHHGSTTCTYNNACTGFVAAQGKVAGPACKALTVTGGTVVSGVRQVSSGTTSMTFKVEGTPPTGGSIAGDQICFYPNYLGNKNDWSLGWYCLPSGSSVAPDPYTVTKTYNEIKAGIRARDPQSLKITDAQIDTDGFRYAGNVHAPQGTFCDGGSKWTTELGNSLYTACTYNSACAGNVKLVVTAKPVGPSCKSLAVTGGTVNTTTGFREVPTAATKLTFNLTGESGSATSPGIARNQICFYLTSTTGGDWYAASWYCVSPNPITTNPYQVELTYQQIKDGIISKDSKATAAKIDSEGFKFAGLVHKPDGVFCDPANVWMGTGSSLYQACSYKAGCMGKVKLVSVVKAQCGQVCVQGKDQCAAGLECVLPTGSKSAYCAKTEYKTQCQNATGNYSVACCQPPAKLACGSSGCTTDASCATGLKCTETATGAKYCAKNTEYNVAACAENPSVATCCQDEKVIQCNSNCTTPSECSTALGNKYTCSAGKCRLIENLSSDTCAPLAPIACNNACTPGATGDAQCKKTDPNFFCKPNTGSTTEGKCRHVTYPDQLNCKKPDPVCLGITMTPTAPKLNDSVTFTCSMVNGIDNYGFRIFEPGESTAKPLAAANKNVSSPYTVTKPGSFRAECRICPLDTSGVPVCLSWPQ